MPLSVALREVATRARPLRPCVGIVLFNAHGKVWVGRRRPKWAKRRQPYVEDHIWQLPQGGIDRGERPRDAAFRELREETGVTRVALLAELPGWLSFELPHDLVGIALKGKFAGQRLRWFAMRFEGTDSQIDLHANGRAKPEFVAWRWADLQDLPGLAVAYKRPVYEAVAEGFAHLAHGAAASVLSPSESTLD